MIHSENIKLYISFYEEKIKLAESYAKLRKMGMVRSSMKEVVEGLVDLIWKTETNGESKKNDLIKSLSRNGYTLEFQVDRHLYSDDGIMKTIVECKAYLDRDMMQRAAFDFNRIVSSVDIKPKTIILALQDAVGDDAYTYHMDGGDIHKIFYLCDGKRDPKKPIWKTEFYKPINEDKLIEFINYIKQ